MIKKLGILLVINLIAINLTAQKPVEVTGQLQLDKLVPVKLFKLSDGKAKEIGSATPAINGDFGFLFYPDYEGIYLISG